MGIIKVTLGDEITTTLEDVSVIELGFAVAYTEELVRQHTAGLHYKPISNFLDKFSKMSKEQIDKDLKSGHIEITFKDGVACGEVGGCSVDTLCLICTVLSYKFSEQLSENIKRSKDESSCKNKS